MNKRGKLIAIEGGDGSGKTVQTDLLVKALKRRHDVSHRITRFDFPQYKKNVYANLLDELLHGDKQVVDFLALNSYIASCAYALDRVIAKDSIIKALMYGGIVVCNRYTPSNIAHQCAKLLEAEWGKLVAFIETGEYDELMIPRPDITLYLSVPAAVSQKLMQKKKDQHESNVPYQERVRRVYEKLSRERKDWVLIDCADSNGAVLTPETIHKKVMTAVLPIL